MNFEQFVAAQLPALVRYATMLAQDRELAQDVAQDALIRAQSRWRRIDAMERPEHYVKRMVTSEYLSWRRRRARRAAVMTRWGAGLAPSTVTDHAEGTVQRSALNQQLAELPGNSARFWCSTSTRDSTTPRSVPRPGRTAIRAGRAGVNQGGDMRSQLADAFEESLRIAPDPADVLVGIRSGIVRQRRRRQLYRTIAVVQAVALVLVATAVTTMALRNRNAPAPANQLDEWTSTLQPGAIPDGWVVRNIMSNAIAENISYGNDTGEGLRVTLDKVGTSPRTDMPGWERTEINGRPAWQLPGDDFRAIIQWQLPSGRWAEVDFAKHYPQSSSPELRAPEVARQVAETTRESGTTRLVTGFEPTYLPAGIRVGGVEVEPAAPGFGTLAQFGAER